MLFFKKFALAAKNNFTPYIFGGFYGIIATALLLYFSSNPTTSKEIRIRLIDLLEERIKSERSLNQAPIISVQTSVAEATDINPTQSVFVFGTAKPRGTETEIRFLAIFEPAGPSLLDKIVGRPGFYFLRSLSHFEAPYPDTMLLKNVVIRDLDQDGNKEILVHLKSNWADSTSLGLIILKKDENEDWNFLSLPSISHLMKETAAGRYKPPARIPVITGPIPVFGTQSKSPEKINPPSFAKLANDGVYEEIWTAVHNRKNVEFVSLRNGGNYFLKSHLVKGYPQIITAAFAVDGNAVLAPHYAVVTVFKIEQKGIVRDSLWNWGYPMTSDVVLNISDLDIESLHKGGIVAHTVGSTFYGYFDFQKLDAPLGAE